VGDVVMRDHYEEIEVSSVARGAGNTPVGGAVATLGATRSATPLGRIEHTADSRAGREGVRGPLENTFRRDGRHDP
jgi:hypothetical protein